MSAWIVILVFFAVLWFVIKASRATSLSMTKVPDIGHVRDTARPHKPIPGAMLPAEIVAAWDAGNYDLARAALQKVAYGMVGPGVSEDNKQLFRNLMAEFAKEDPLYRELMTKIKPLVLARPGILQTDLYPALPQYDQEVIRYVTYFGHEIGDIHRRKKGRTYELLPAGRVIDLQ